MNHAMVRYIIGKLMLIIALLMLPSVAVALIYGEGWRGVWPFLLPMGGAAAAGYLLVRRKPRRPDFFMREGFAVVGLTWVLMSVVGAVPFVISGAIPNFLDAVFEAASGFTTTGASILSHPEALPHAQLFWRSFSHLVGGMGVLVFALAVMPRIKSDDVFIMKAEVPGPIFGKIRAQVRSTARVLYAIYLAMTAVLTVLLTLGGMPVFDSLVHAFGAAGTGGFGIKTQSVGYYNSPYIHYVIGIGMILFGVNFNLYYALLCRNVKAFFKSEELRWYIGVVIGAMALILFNTRHLYVSFEQQFREVFFTVSSILTTTGYSINNYEAWPLLSHVVLLMLMFIGGMAGSTAGGLKVSRFAIYAKSVILEIRSSLSPNRRLPLHFEGKALSGGMSRQVHRYLAVYAFAFSALLLVCALHAPNFTVAFSAVAATFNNIGPGLDIVGPTGNYAMLHPLSKLMLTLGMIMGRLEIIPMVVLFSPKTWRRV